MKLRLIVFLVAGLLALFVAIYLSEDPVVAEIRTRAKQGDAAAQIQLGDAYGYGLRGVKYDVEESVKWYRKAAEQGNIDAQNRLGDQLSGMHPLGARIYPSNTSQWYIIDCVEGIYWNRKAAEQGHVKAQERLGLAYSSGFCIPRDNAEAFKWYSLAAEQGDLGAMLAVGDAYYRGQGTKQDYAKAYKWLSLSAPKSPNNYLYPLATLDSRFTAQQREEGLRMAREWKPSPTSPHQP